MDARVIWSRCGAAAEGWKFVGRIHDPGD